jgi:hypothetical protein
MNVIELREQPRQSLFMYNFPMPTSHRVWQEVPEAKERPGNSSQVVSEGFIVTSIR